MRIIIDTELERIIVPDSFFNQIDRMNKVLEENGVKAEGKDEFKKVEYTAYVKKAFDTAAAKPLIRKADIPQYRKK